MLRAPGVCVRALLICALARAASGSWVLSWEDDFNGTSLNTSLWTPRQNESHCEPCELELYVSSALQVSNGSLIITTAADKVVGPGGQVFNYTSGWVDTKGKASQQYGKWEIRAKLPPSTATGVWPAHWTLSESSACWPTQGEIDIMEYIAGIPLVDDVFGSYRWGTACDDDKQILPGGGYPPPPGRDWSDDFHVFSVEWNATALTFLVDGNAYETKTSAEVILPTTAHYTILNTAVAPFWPPGPGATYPVQHVIDYVRVWTWVP